MRRFLRFVAQENPTEWDPDDDYTGSNGPDLYLNSPSPITPEQNGDLHSSSEQHETFNSKSSNQRPQVDNPDDDSGPLLEENQPASMDRIDSSLCTSKSTQQLPPQSENVTSPLLQSKNPTSTIFDKEHSAEEEHSTHVCNEYESPVQSDAINHAEQNHNSTDVSPEVGDTFTKSDRLSRSFDMLPSEIQLKSLIEVLAQFSRRTNSNAQNSTDVHDTAPAAVVNALRELAELMVWADQHYQPLWDVFMEYSVMSLLVRCLHVSVTTSYMPNGFIAQDSYEVPVEKNLPNDVIFDDKAFGKQSLSDPSGSAPNGHAHNQNADEAFLASAPLLSSANADTKPVLAISQEQLPEVAATLNNTSQENTDVSSSEVSLSAPGGLTLKRPSPSLYDTFMISRSTPPRTNCINDNTSKANIHSTDATSMTIEVQSQILQTLSIIVQSVATQHSLLCLFSSNHINDILSFPFVFDNEEVIGLFMSVIKTISLKLDQNLLQLFFNPHTQSFTLYSVAVQFYNHSESMIRIAVRNVTLTLCALNDKEVLQYVAADVSEYLHNSVMMLKNLCGEAARAFELLMDDGREVPRSRSRTGLFRRNVRLSDLMDKLEEIENLCAYFGDLSGLSDTFLRPNILYILKENVFAPLFCPLSSHASPEAVRLMKRRRWRLSNSDLSSDSSTPALPLFDAAARTLLLAFMLTCLKSSSIGTALLQEISRPTPRFEYRHVFHALKALCADVSGTERVAYVALLAIEAALSCDGMTSKLMQKLNLDFEISETIQIEREQTGEDDESVLEKDSMSISSGFISSQTREMRGKEMVMTLKDFDVPMTPTISASSIPTTPTSFSVSPMASLSSPSEFQRAQSSTSIDEIGATMMDENDDWRVILSLQTGVASMREVLSSILLVVRRREVRTKRVVCAVCRVIQKVGEKMGNWAVVADVAKIALDELAAALQFFLKSRATTIVAIESAFDKFASEIETTPSVGDSPDEHPPNVESFVLIPENAARVAKGLPRGAGKKRRARFDGLVAPIEREDVQTIVGLIKCYEVALRNANSHVGIVSLLDIIKGTMEECSTHDSYLDKRDALQNVASAIIRHGEFAEVA